jgi:uncharacterized protein YjbI with pentapeptide repeats
MPADDVAARLRAGDSVVLPRGTEIRGRLLLAREVVQGSFTCRLCTFAGPISAADATFERTVDLTGGVFTGDVVFTGASFRGSTLFGTVTDLDGEARTARFPSRADFSLAVFEGPTNFSGAVFAGPASFQESRLGDAAFAGTIFTAPVSFAGAQFLGEADFPSANFLHGVTFKGARFARGAIFLATTFDSPAHASVVAQTDVQPNEPEEAANFSLVKSKGSIVFSRAVFHSLPGEQVAIFDDLASTGELDLDRAEFLSLAAEDSPDPYAEHGNRVAMDGVDTGGLVLALDHVDSISDEGEYDGSRRNALAAIRAVADANGDLGLANDAEYQLRLLRAQNRGAIARAADTFFYRGVAGYFVRPGHPLLLLAILVVLLTLLRYGRERAGAPHVGFAGRRGRPSRRQFRVPCNRRGRLEPLRRRCADLAGCFLDTIARVVPRWGNARTAPPTSWGRAEVAAYRVLLVLALIGLANSNPALNRMLEALV